METSICCLQTSPLRNGVFYQSPWKCASPAIDKLGEDLGCSLGWLYLLVLCTFLGGFPGRWSRNGSFIYVPFPSSPTPSAVSCFEGLVLLPVAPANTCKEEGMSPHVWKSWLPLAPAAGPHWHHLSNHAETVSTPSLMYRDVLVHQASLPGAGEIDPLEGLLLLHGSQRVSGRQLAEWGVPSSILHGMGHPIVPPGASSLPFA